MKLSNLLKLSEIGMLNQKLKENFSELTDSDLNFEPGKESRLTLKVKNAIE